MGCFSRSERPRLAASDFRVTTKVRAYQLRLELGITVLSHGEAKGILISPGGSLGLNNLFVGFGRHADRFPVWNGLFIKAPNGWRETVFENVGPGVINPFRVVLFNDPNAYVLGGTGI